MSKESIEEFVLHAVDSVFESDYLSALSAIRAIMPCHDLTDDQLNELIEHIMEAMDDYRI